VLDGWTDRQTELRWLRHAIAVPAVAPKNSKQVSTISKYYLNTKKVNYFKQSFKYIKTILIVFKHY